MTEWAANEEAECLATWGVTPQQEATLVQQLRDEIELETGPLAAEWDDRALRRFLRARKHNILKAKLMFLDMIQWRKQESVDTVLTDFVFHEREEFAKFYPEGYYGVDRAGRPIYVQQPGKMDMPALWKFTTLERCMRYHIQVQEHYRHTIEPACSIKAGRSVEQSLLIVDMDGFGLTSMTTEFRKVMGLVMQIDQDFYPELMWKCVVINAPTTFKMLWSMVKYFMDTRTQNKIEVLGVDYQAELLRLVAPENLMQCYGGTNHAPLSAEPGPWQEPEVLQEVERRWQQRLKECGRPASMTRPPLPSSGLGHEDGASAELDSAATH